MRWVNGHGCAVEEKEVLIIYIYIHIFFFRKRQKTSLHDSFNAGLKLTFCLGQRPFDRTPLNCVPFPYYAFPRLSSSPYLFTKIPSH